MVIAIIALLIGILLPALGRARDAGRFMVCLSNQRQIGMALSMYASTYKDYTPRESGTSEAFGRPQVPAYPGSQYNLAWPFQLRPFLDPEARTDVPDGGMRDKYARAVYYRDPARPKDPHNIHYVNNGLAFLRPGIVASYSKPPTPLHRYSRTSDVIYLTCLTDDPNGQRWGTWYSPANREIDIAIYYDMWRASNVNGIGGNSAQTWQRTAPKRHSSGSAAMYMDGHADGLERDKVTDIRSWDDGDYKRF